MLTCNVPGRKKLKQVEAEIIRLSHVSHPGLLRILAVKLSLPHGSGSGSARLVILSEERPRLSLADLLEDCENLREDRVSVRIFSLAFAVESLDVLFIIGVDRTT